MFLYKNNIFIMNGKSIVKISYNRRPFAKTIDITHEKSLGARYRNREFKNDSIIIIEGEEIYIKYITVPRVKKNELEKIVKNELGFYYRTDEDIIFSYSILKKNKINMDLAVFYINGNSLNNVDLKNINNIKYIYLIQFCYAKYVKNISSLNKYIITFIYKQNLYFIFCENGLIKYNYIFRNFQEGNVEFENCLNYFIDLNKDIADNLEMIYALGFAKETIKDINTSYCVKDLGNIEQNKLFKTVI
ncbi:hypothetical protein [Clostridium sp.]|uniref:hypothetical protein n=1 Tax=Clostridium sp. TaxID=1506 RepID=UPI002588870B|nr:hypothetical protein [Clostridium sp.]MDF2504040.1 hypothetical protein [Clostridium sp.]